MGLTQAQRSLIEKARSVGTGDLAIPLDDEACGYLVARIAHDLGVAKRLRGVPDRIASFFIANPTRDCRAPGIDFWRAVEKLLILDQDADTYFSCLASLLKARLKYERILEAQPIPTMDQVGPRGLLQYGSMSPRALAGLLLWRKWLYDIDNRAAQETGYLFEPIIAHAIGGVPASARKSPIKRVDGKGQRQVDCIKKNRAYEVKLRVTIAASGQGRWREELSFPKDCRASRFTPCLIVLDPTDNPKLSELRAAFEAERGKVYVGEEAWRHLEAEAGPTMARFVKLYVRTPIEGLLREIPDPLPSLRIDMEPGRIVFTIGGECFAVTRTPSAEAGGESEQLPEDVDDELPGV